jgi:hypothetical protein
VPAGRQGAHRVATGLADRQGDAKLQNLQTVKVDDAPAAPLAGFKDGVYVASAKLVAPGVDNQTVSWAVSKSMLTTGGGLAYALDSVTREFSDLGSAAKEGSPARDYADAIAGSDAYDRSRGCVKG